MSSTAFQLQQSPSNGITSTMFENTSSSNRLAVTSWDNYLRIYDIDQSNLLSSMDFQTPLLCTVYNGDNSKLLVGGLNGFISSFDCNMQSILPLGVHSDAVKHIGYNSTHCKLRNYILALIYSGGWDRKVKSWDLRLPPWKPITELNLHGKVYAMDVSADRLVCADSLKRVYIYDIKKDTLLKQPEQMRDGIFSYQMRYLKMFQDQKGFALASVEGRVAWEYFDKSADSENTSYTFKCHRIKQGKI